jgi:secreted PhoX family phosphatase
MLGRLKHEGANLATTRDGHVVAYMGDDQVNEYIYKFVSRTPSGPVRVPGAREHNMRLLETGRSTSRGSPETSRRPCDASVEQEHDGTGVWVPLASTCSRTSPA